VYADRGGENFASMENNTWDTLTDMARALAIRKGRDAEHPGRGGLDDSTAIPRPFLKALILLYRLF
jgi:hypothetical protein